MPAEPTPVDARDVRNYDDTCDVLVLGFGCAGAAAAWEAASAGADTLILERTSESGGSSAVSGGEVYLGGGTSVQQACGFDDDAEQMTKFLLAALGPHADKDRIAAYCEGSVELFDWLVARGVPFGSRLWDSPTWVPSDDSGLMWMGENSWPYCDLAVPAPRGHRPAQAGECGWLLMRELMKATHEAGVRVAADSRAISLIVDDGAVVGVVARVYGEQRIVRARRAVIVATGGFVDNPDMVSRHAPSLLGHGAVSDGLDDGSGIVMSTAAGAAVRRMASVQTALSLVPAMMANGMIVNGLGRRFINEDTYPGLVSHAAVHTQPAPAWVVIDEQGFESIPRRDRWGVRPTLVDDDFGALERSMGVPEGALAATVREYNAHAAHGLDPYFHKAARYLQPLQPPYAVIDTRTSMRREPGVGPQTGAVGFTLGGLDTDLDGRVQTWTGEAIPGLYAAGRASAAMHGNGYISGTSLGDGMFFGRRAGQSAGKS
ncbi:MAG: FAD-dependent oxidoreductase [Jatrophihabitans sp.]